VLNRLSIDLLVNLASLACLAVAGIALNVMIGRTYGPEALGLFNIVFAMFIFGSQFGSAGLQYSTLRHVSLSRSGRDTRLIFTSALQIVLVTSTVTIAVAVACTPLLAVIFEIPGLSRAWLLAIPGLWCFSINKVLLAFLNGLGAMRAFALYQSCRYLLMLAAMALLVAVDVEAADITLLLTLSEATLLFLLGGHLYVLVGKLPTAPPGTAGWRKEHLRFGGLAMPSGVIAELNTRVDVLLLGAILGSFQTGIYSVAILLAEGFGQVVFVVRNVVNPLLGPIVERRDQEALSRLVRNIGGATLALMMMGGAALVAAFPLFDRYLLLGRFGDAFWPLLFLVVGLTLAGPLLVFSMILSQGGRPGVYSALMTSILVSNIVFNLVGVYALGIVGAAIGTAISYLVGVATLVVICRRVFGLRLSPL